MSTDKNTEPKMRTGRALIMASLPFAKENKKKSWYYVISTIVFMILAFGASFNPFHWSLQLFSGIIMGLLMIKFFIIYHDFNHFAILRNSKIGNVIMNVFGIFILAPITIWKRSHNFHHSNNSKLTSNGVGAYPLLARADFLKLPKKERWIYMIVRHPLTISLGYLTLFMFDFNVKTFIQSPKKHIDSFIALIFHFSMVFIIVKYFGVLTLIFSWTIPFIIANGLGSYLFYAQHNFPDAIYVANKDWDYTTAALKSTSFLKMGAIMNWFTGNIGYHHVHHVNHHIPFYRLKEAMAAIPELQNPFTTSLSPKDMAACLRLKVWDPDLGKMAPL